MILFYTLVFTLPIPNHPFWAYHVGPLTILKCLGILCLLSALVEMLKIGSCPPAAKSVPSRWFTIYFLVAFLSCLMRDGLDAVNTDEFMFTISTFSLFVVTTTMVGSLKRLRWAVLVALASVTWGSLYVIRQWQQYHNLYAGFRTFGGLAGDPNYYAVTIVLWVPLISFWLISERPRWEKWFCLGCLAVISVGFIFAASRGGLIGLTVALLFLVFKTRNRLRNLALVGLLMLPIVFAPGQSGFNRLLHPSESDEESSQYRFELWQSAENTFLAHPFFGVGMGHYRPTVIKDGQVVDLPFHVAHNTYIGLIADLGLAGIIPFIGIFFSALANLRRIAQRTTQSGQVLLHQVAVGLQAGLVGYMVCAFFLSTLWQQVMWFAVFLSMSLSRIEALTLANPDADLVPGTA